MSHLKCEVKGRTCVDVHYGLWTNQREKTRIDTGTDL